MKIRKAINAAMAAVMLWACAGIPLAQAGAYYTKVVPLVWLRSISGSDAFSNGQSQQVSQVLDGRHNSSNMTVATAIALQDTSQWIDVRDHLLRSSPVYLNSTPPVASLDSTFFGTFTVRTSPQSAGTAGIMDTIVIFRDGSQDGFGSTPFDSLTSHVVTDSIRVPGVVAVDSITVTACPTLAVDNAGKVIRYFSYSWNAIPGIMNKAAAGLSSQDAQGFNFIRFRVKLTAGDQVAMSGSPGSGVSCFATFAYPAQEPNYNTGGIH